MPRFSRHEQALTAVFIGVIAFLFIFQAKIVLQPDMRVTFSLERMNLAFGYGSSASSASSSASSAAPACAGTAGANQTLLYSGHCYMLFTGADKTWTNAKTACAAYSGSYLASITASAEHNQIVSGFTLGQTTFIGINDRTTENSFAWDHGEVLSYTNWYTNQPDDSGGNQDCGALYSPFGYAWDDNNCSTAFDYLCEMTVNPVCGNGVKDNAEACDDGDTSSGDGCSATCTVESGWSCTGTAPSICSGVCGNGIITADEDCDDGNTSNGDGCSSICAVQSGWSCTGTPSSCETTCGDSIVAGSEQCDDGNATDTDACRNTCISATCGDSVVQPNGLDNASGTSDDEACDDGGESATCNDNCSAVACGDQNINEAAGETCDDGNSSNTDACLNSCVLASCGDSYMRNGVETCEPPGVGTCSTACQEVSGIGGSNNTSESSSAVSRRMPPPNCGNGVVELDLGEACDQGRFNGLSPFCDRWCNQTYCGDGEVHAEYEECEPTVQDDGTFAAQTCGGRTCTIPVCTAAGSCYGGCSWVFLPACRVEETPDGEDTVTPPERLAEELPGASSSAPFGTEQASSGGAAPEIPVFESTPVSSPTSAPTVTPPFSLPIFSIGLPASSSVTTLAAASCGNGLREGSELCDDGARNSDTLPDSCRTSCRTPYCGDRVTDYGEECDDGNDILGDACTPLCTRSACGNGVLEPGEECDDGLQNSDSRPDSCSSRCLLPRCGDGILDASFGEQCDAGYDNFNAPDSCHLDCRRPSCGDGYKDSGEQCDDGNTSNFDNCSSSCAVIGCGNGIIEHAETCDDGNVRDGDGCSAVCAVEQFTLLQWLNNAIRLPFQW
jgi:cysteine-rich repeat protein